MTESFLCTSCKSCMCDDCREIAEEYQELLENRTRALMIANSNEEQAKRRLETETRRADMFEKIAKAGVGDIIAAWIDKEIKQILEPK